VITFCGRNVPVGNARVAPMEVAYGASKPETARRSDQKVSRAGAPSKNFAVSIGNLDAVGRDSTDHRDGEGEAAPAPRNPECPGRSTSIESCGHCLFAWPGRIPRRDSDASNRADQAGLAGDKIGRASCRERV